MNGRRGLLGDGGGGGGEEEKEDDEGDEKSVMEAKV